MMYNYLYIQYRNWKLLCPAYNLILLVLVAWPF